MTTNTLTEQEIAHLNRTIAARCKEVRAARGISQELAARQGLSLTTLKKMERQGNADLRSYHQLADALDVNIHTLFEPPGSPIRFTSSFDGAVATPYGASYTDPMKRRDFVIGVPSVLAALAAPVPVRELFSPDNRSRIPDEEGIRELAVYCEDLRLQERQLGGAALCGFAVTVQQQVGKWLDHCAESRSVYGELQALYGNLGAWIGWLAFDAEQLDFARTQSEHAVSHGAMLGRPDITLRAMDNLSMVWARTGNYRQARDVAAAALKASTDAPSQVQAVLQLRLARAQALLGNKQEMERSLGAANRLATESPSDICPAWADWADPIGIASNAGKTLANTGWSGEAIPLLEAAIRELPETHQVSIALNTIVLARAYAQQGEAAHAGFLATAALPQVLALDSKRTRLELQRLYAYFMHAQTHPASVREFVDAYETHLSASRIGNPSSFT